MIKITQNQHLAPGAVAIIQFSPCHEAEWPLVTILSLDNRHRQWTDWRVQALTCIMIQHINTKTSWEMTTLLQAPLLSVWMYRQWCPLAIVWVRLSTTCMARMDSWVPLHQGYQFWHNTENFLAKTRIISVCMYERSSRTCCIRIHLQMWATQSWWIGPNVGFCWYGRNQGTGKFHIPYNQTTHVASNTQSFVEIGKCLLTKVVFRDIRQTIRVVVVTNGLLKWVHYGFQFLMNSTVHQQLNSNKTRVTTSHICAKWLTMWRLVHWTLMGELCLVQQGVHLAYCCTLVPYCRNSRV